MMGDRTKIQEALFYEFRLEDHVPAGGIEELFVDAIV